MADHVPPSADCDAGQKAGGIWQARHVESGVVVVCHDRAEAEAHVRESASGPWVAECTTAPDQSHTRTQTHHGPDFCKECSEAIQEWVPWPCPTRLTPPGQEPS